MSLTDWYISQLCMHTCTLCFFSLHAVDPYCSSKNTLGLMHACMPFELASYSEKFSYIPYS